MLEAALAEERHRRLEDAIPRDGFSMSRLALDAPPLVVVFHALDLEVARVRAPGWRVLRCRPEELASPSVPTLAWIRTGMGVEAARRAVDAIPDVPIQAALCTGFAGALARDLTPRMLVVADPLLDADGRTQATPLAALLAETAHAAGLACRRGALVTVSRVADTPAKKARLHDELGALAVDMESAVLASALAARGIPAAAARVVLDTAEEEIPGSLAALWRRPGLLVSGVRIAARMHPCARISARLLEAWLGGPFGAAQRQAEPQGRDDCEAEQADGR
jgi:nucleoside phosphorylase